MRSNQRKLRTQRRHQYVHRNQSGRVRRFFYTLFVPAERLDEGPGIAKSS